MFQCHSVSLVYMKGQKAGKFRYISDMQTDVELTVLNRGLLSDEFIGYVPVPLSQFGVYERPESR